MARYRDRKEQKAREAVEVDARARQEAVEAVQRDNEVLRRGARQKIEDERYEKSFQEDTRRSDRDFQFRQDQATASAFDRSQAREDRLIEGVGARAGAQLDQQWQAQTANSLSPRDQAKVAIIRGDAKASPPTTSGPSPAPSYRSPFSSDIARLGKAEAADLAAIEGGDTRKGFLNINSRQDAAGQAQRQRLKLQALELQDMVSKGVIDQDEADRRADGLMGSR